MCTSVSLQLMCAFHCHTRTRARSVVCQAVLRQLTVDQAFCFVLYSVCRLPHTLWWRAFCYLLVCVLVLACLLQWPKCEEKSRSMTEVIVLVWNFYRSWYKILPMFFLITSLFCLITPLWMNSVTLDVCECISEPSVSSNHEVKCLGPGSKWSCSFSNHRIIYIIEVFGSVNASNTQTKVAKTG